MSLLTLNWSISRSLFTYLQLFAFGQVLNHRWHRYSHHHGQLLHHLLRSDTELGGYRAAGAAYGLETAVMVDKACKCQPRRYVERGLEIDLLKCQKRPTETGLEIDLLSVKRDLR